MSVTRRDSIAQYLLLHPLPPLPDWVASCSPRHPLRVSHVPGQRLRERKAQLCQGLPGRSMSMGALQNKIAVAPELTGAIRFEPGEYIGGWSSGLLLRQVVVI